jgi:hypothetical protein
VSKGDRKAAEDRGIQQLAAGGSCRGCSAFAEADIGLAAGETFARTASAIVIRFAPLPMKNFNGKQSRDTGRTNPSHLFSVKDPARCNELGHEKF